MAIPIKQAKEMNQSREEPFEENHGEDAREDDDTATKHLKYAGVGVLVVCGDERRAGGVVENTTRALIVDYCIPASRCRPEWCR